MDSKNAIEIKNVVKSFKVEVADPERKGILNKNPTKVIERRVLDDISFNVKKGEVLGILGRNGCGKSTLLSLIARILEPDSGIVECSGKVTSILELGMGFHPDMSGRENIFLKGELYGFSRKEMESRVETIIAYSGLSEYIDNPVRTYSSGMTGRLAFAIMVNADSEIMLVDEILSVGDAAFRIKAQEHFKKMAQSGKTVIFVSHNIADIEGMCSRAIWIENGKVIKDGSAKDICAQYQLKMSESPDIVEDLAVAGVAESQYRLALMYRDGTTVFGQSDELCREWMQKASDQGHTLAQVEFGNILFTEGNIQDAIVLYQSAANKGNNEARLKLASCNNHDDSLRSKVKDIFLKMSESGRPLDQFRCADYLLRIAWTPEDRKNAFEMFLKSAESYPQAMYQVAVMYRDGIGVARDYRMMENYLRKASDVGHVQSIYLLAEIYRAGRLLPRNDGRAFELYLKGAGFGNANCQYQVAVMYRDGIGCEPDIEKSEKWFDKYSYSSVIWNFIQAADWAKVNTDLGKGEISEIYSKASDCGVASAAWNVGILTEKMDGLEHLAQSVNADAILRYANYLYDVCADYPSALKYYKKASDLGNVFAMVRAGDMIRDGRGCNSDTSCALLYYVVATSYGSTTAIGNIVNLFVVGTVDEMHYERAMNQLVKLANAGSLDAASRLGSYYYGGVGVQRDFHEALIWYKVASKLGDIRSIIRLAEMNLDGKGTNSNLTEAIALFKKAAYSGNTFAIHSIILLYVTRQIDDLDIFSEMIGIMHILADSGNNEALKRQAMYYYEGYGLERNKDKALEYLKKSVGLGDTSSIIKIYEYLDNM